MDRHMHAHSRLSPRTSHHRSTLVNFALRFYDPEQGAILLDGKDLRSLNVHSLRQHVAYVGVRA